MPLNFVAKAAITVGLAAANAALTMSQKIEGPRLDDLKYTSGDYGAPLTRLWGKRRINPPVFWGEDLKEVKRRRKTKGGKYNEYTYFGTWAVALADHEIAGISRIWFDTHLVFDLTGAGPVTPFDFGDRSITKDERGPLGIGLGGTNYADAVALYLGTETQEPDPRMQATVEAEFGEGSCPAYRGVAYIVFKDIPLEKLGNRIPQVSVEVLGTADGNYPYEIKPRTVSISDAFFSSAYATFTAISGSSYEIWDTAARGVMISGSTGVSLNVSPGYGTASNGAFRGVSADNRYLYIASPDGVEWSQEFDFGASYDQERVFSLQDGNGTDHWGTMPWSTFRDFYYDGVRMLMDDLTGAIWRPTHFFRDSYGDVWACGCLGTVGNTTAYFRRMTALGDSPIASDFFAIPGLSATSSLDEVYACHFVDDTHDQFVFSWAGAKTYIYDIAAGTVTDTLSAALGERAALIYANLAPGATTIWYSSTGSDFYEYSLADFSLVRQLDMDTWLNGYAIFRAVYDPTTHAMIVARDGQANLMWCYLDRVSSAGVPLSTIAGDVADWCGVEDHSFSDLTQTLPGWSVTQGGGDNMLEPLFDAYDSDIRPHDFTVQGIKRTGTSSGTIDVAWFTRREPRYSVRIRQARELPRAITINFADTEADQQVNNVRADRPLDATDARADETLDLSTLALAPDDARPLADRYFRRLWNSRKEPSLALTAKAIGIEPGDVKVLGLDGSSMTAQLRRMTIRADDSIETDWRYDHTSLAALDGAGGAAFDGRDPSVVIVPLISKGFVLDVPLLTDADNAANPVLYIAAAPYAAGAWPGATVFEGTDGEYSDEFGAVASNAPATWGYATEALGTANPWLWDRGGSVNVVLQVGTLTGCSEADIDANPSLNLCLLGSELVNFTTATLEGDGSYTLSGFKRGRRGTEWAVGDHTASDVFVLLETAEAVQTGLSDVGTDLTFKAVTEGRTATGAFPIDLEPYTGASLKPYAPADVRAVKQANGDWIISWKWRTRVGGAFRSGIAPSSAEASLSFHVTLGDGVSEDTKTASSSPYTWTVAAQTTDTGAEVMAGSLECAVAQISAAIGDGWATEITA